MANVSTLKDLFFVRESPADSYVQTSDIDMSITNPSTPADDWDSGTSYVVGDFINYFGFTYVCEANNTGVAPGGFGSPWFLVWETSSGWLPIGGDGGIGGLSYDFTGSYDGSGFKITGLYINRPANDYNGLFAGLSGAVIKDLHLSGDITGNDNSGLLFGKSSSASDIDEVFVSGSVSGTNYQGGICGYDTGSSIDNCFSFVDVSGTQHAGGFMGRADSSSCSNCYSVGSVSGSSDVGGFSGSVSSETFSECFWDTLSSGQVSDSSASSEGKTTSQMKDVSTFAGWDLSSVWQMSLADSDYDGYPIFLWMEGGVPDDIEIISDNPSVAIDNVEVDAPTLLSPVGGENYFGQYVDISWEEPVGDGLWWYEIFVTDNFSHENINNLMKVAVAKKGDSSFSYKVDNNFRGDKCRIGIRTVDYLGKRSQLIISPNHFTISSGRLPTPVFSEPVSGGVYFSQIPFVFDFSSISGRGSYRSFYQIYYKSESLGVDWSVLKNNVKIGSPPFSVDIRKLQPAPDYCFRVESTDGSRVSSPSIIKNVTLNCANYFVIDTVAPNGSVEIEDKQEYTNEKSLVLRLNAEDDSSAVKDFQIEQEDTRTGDVNTSSYTDMSPIITWDLMGGDGEKIIKIRYRDYGDNYFYLYQDRKYFRTYKNLLNREITAVCESTNGVYYGIAGDGDENPPQLYLNQTMVSETDGDISCIIIYNEALYLGIVESNGKGTLQIYSGGGMVDVVNSESELLSDGFSGNSLFSAESVITSMCEYHGYLFIGLKNGEVLRFDGSGVVSVHSEYKNKNSVKNIFSDGNVMLIFFDNTYNVVCATYDSLDVLNFSVITLES